MKHFSYWEAKYFMPFWDVAIIGSGITGLTTAIHLKKRFPEHQIAILERGALPSGASTRNAGFACFGSVSEILSDLEIMSENEVFELIESRYRGLIKLRELLGDEKIDFKPTGGFELFRTDESETYERCLGSLGYINAELVQVIGKQAFRDAKNRIREFGFSDVDQMLVNDLEGCIDTGRMMKNLVNLAREEGVEIFNGMEVSDYTVSGDRCILETNSGEILARQVVVATNGFAKKLLPELDVEPCRGQVLITNRIKDLKIDGCFHYNRGFDYFRNIDGRVLLGGGRNLSEEAETTTEEGLTDEIQDHLEGLLREVILPGQEFEIDMRWSGIMGIGKEKTVLLKKISERVYCVTRLSGMGVALGTALGEKMAEMIEAEIT